VLLLDGHGSRFDIDFLDYIAKKETEWCVLIGVPYGTHLWQVADSSEQNWRFKVDLKKAKESVIMEKGKIHLPMHVEKEAIVGLVHHDFLASFANIDNNKKAIQSRGWSPLNYKLLDHLELRNEINKDGVQNAVSLCELTGVSSATDTNSSKVSGASH
jgi:hypothetical protein